MRTRTWTAALVVAGLAIAGCGDDDEGSAEDVGSETTAAPDAGGIEPSGSEVVMADFAFQPTELTVAAGATISVTNDDSAAHTFTSEDGGFDTEVGGGESGEATAPSEPGEYDFVCRFHSSMTGTLTVE